MSLEEIFSLGMPYINKYEKSILTGDCFMLTHRAKGKEEEENKST